MSKINTTAAFIALDAFAMSGDTARVTLVAALVAAGVATREDAYPIVTAWSAARCNCPMIDGQKAAKGTKVLDSKSANYENAKTTRRRAMDAFAPAEKPEPADKAESAATVKPATKAEREAFAALQAARAALKAAEEAFALVCGSKARAKALDAALSA